MKISVAAKTGALGALQAQLSTVASGDTARGIMSELAADFHGRVLRQFAVGRGPYGNAWPAPKKGNPPGRDTEHLMLNIDVKVYSLAQPRTRPSARGRTEPCASRYGLPR